MGDIVVLRMVLKSHVKLFEMLKKRDRIRFLRGYWKYNLLSKKSSNKTGRFFTS